MPSRPSTNRNKFPRRIKIGAHQWEVHLTDQREMDDKWGDVDFRHRRIRIDVNAPDSLLADTLLHEVIHVIHQDRPMAPLWATGEEEAITQAYADALMQVFVDNPKFARLLLG